MILILFYLYFEDSKIPNFESVAILRFLSIRHFRKCHIRSSEIIERILLMLKVSENKFFML